MMLLNFLTRVLFISVLLLSGMLPRLYGEDKATSEAIWRSLRARQKAAESASVTWAQRLFIPAPFVKSKRDAAAPAKDVRLPKLPSKLVLAGDRVRYETFSASFRSGRDAKPVPMIDVFDGTRHRSLTNDEYGAIKEGGEFDQWQNVHLMGLLLNLRPLRPEMFGTDPEGWTIENRSAVVDGKPCVVLARQGDASNPGYIQRVYLDPAKEYVPLRYESAYSGQPDARTNIRYERSSAPHWVPSSWTAIFFVGGLPAQETENSLEEVALGIAISEETFSLDYPAGTQVTVSGKKSADDLAAPEQRLVADGEGNLIPRRETVAEETSTATGWSRWPLIFAAIGAAALGVALLLWRRYA
ncbi:MAG: hypothetical protein WBC44_00225 [Planctomycetaceae bacterium]